MLVKKLAKWVNISLKILIFLMFAGRVFEIPVLCDK